MIWDAIWADCIVDLVTRWKTDLEALSLIVIDAARILRYTCYSPDGYTFRQ